MVKHIINVMVNIWLTCNFWANTAKERRETAGPETSPIPQRLCRVTRMMLKFLITLLRKGLVRTSADQNKCFYYITQLQQSKAKIARKGHWIVMPFHVFSFFTMEQFVSFKRHLLASHSSLKYIVVKWVSINNGIAGIDYF